jgi:hypothetical protein
MSLPLTEQLDASYAALANAKRRGMIVTLSFRPATVGQLAEEHGLSLPAAGLIQRKKVGRTNFVAISRRSLQMAQNWLLQFRTDWGSDRETLENYIITAQTSRKVS